MDIYLSCGHLKLLFEKWNIAKSIYLQEKGVLSIIHSYVIPKIKWEPKCTFVKATTQSINNRRCVEIVNDGYNSSIGLTQFGIYPDVPTTFCFLILSSNGIIYHKTQNYKITFQIVNSHPHYSFTFYLGLFKFDKKKMNFNGLHLSKPIFLLFFVFLFFSVFYSFDILKIAKSQFKKNKYKTFSRKKNCFSSVKTILKMK